MKMITVRSRHAACALVSALAFGYSFVPGQLQAAPDKLELLSGAIKARQKGNLTESRKILEDLNTASPGDQRVISLLNNVNAEIALKEKVSTKEVPVTEVAKTDEKKTDEKKPDTKKPEVKKTEPKKKELTKDEIAEILKGNASGENKVKLANADLELARNQLAVKKYDEANATLIASLEKVKEDPLTEAQFKEMQELRKEVYLEKTDNAIRAKDVKIAEESLKEYANLAGKTDEYETRTRSISAIRKNPYTVDAAALSPDGVIQKRKVDELLTKGRALYIAGDNEAAYRVFQEVETSDGENPEAKFFQMKIAEQRKELNRINYYKTREIFLQTVNQNWALPTIYDRSRTQTDSLKETTTQRKLNLIKIDDVNFRGLPLSRVIETLSALSVKQDNTKLTPKPGVNIVLLDPTGADPTVNITLRDLSLQRVLEFVCEQVGYEADVSEDAVTISPSSGEKSIRLRTEFFPVTQNILIRMGVVKPSATAGAAAAAVDPFATPAPGAGEAGAAGGGDSREESLKKFFERAGVGFANVTGSSLALTEAQLIVTQTQKNLERIGKILRQFSDTRQVTISSRFLEVQQGDLEEFGFDFLLRGNNAVFATNNRSLNDAFAPRLNAGRGININTAAGSIVVNPDPITGTPGGIITTEAKTSTFNSAAPNLPGAVNIGSGIGAAGVGGSLPRTVKGGTMQLQESGLAAYQGTIGSYELEAVIKALSQKQGNDLMSAPTVTTMSDRQARIVVSQELLYPTEYGDINIETGGGGGRNGGGGSSTIAIAPGTPTGFEKRDVGIEMTVTPKIQEDGSIFLDIEPRVTEFEGFIEYGSPSVAISGTTTVTVPPGFFQPVFTVRHVKTEVTIWDGATVLLGGLSREQVLSVEDKVPILGDIPFIGRLFSSKGQSSSKKNLLIFVTANMIGPGGAPARQNFPGLPQGSIYSDAVLVTPAGPVQRASFNEANPAR